MRRSDLFRIDASSPVPLYHQIKENIHQLIEEEELVPGDLCRRSANWVR
jgi:DNA-binding transcriptional regulator YhcF (GntR family)